eukprot:TRINITY_DN1280_c0_g3_i4.p1 TRINITY_DN1280_c0_g3~~TRINITY_DN1280_c0_g3_i4.p1  ORF type:complete len:310 (-),score=104.03 TRINITY_DN1280_c0_g3_i4:276-1148(-)
MATRSFVTRPALRACAKRLAAHSGGRSVAAAVAGRRIDGVTLAQASALHTSGGNKSIVGMHRHEPMAPVNKTPMIGSAEEAVTCIKSGDNIFVQGMAATPSLLTNAMAAHGKAARLEGCTVYHLHTEGDCPYVTEDCDGIFRTKSFFLGGNVRKATQEGRADYVPIFLSETPRVFRKGIVPLDVALVQVSPPDKHGFCSLGTSVDCTRAALQTARTVIALVNKNVPRTHGDGIIHYTNLDRVVYHDQPLYTSHAKAGSPADDAIGKLIAEHLVVDGATLQVRLLLIVLQL